MKKAISWILCAALLLSSMPTFVFAEDDVSSEDFQPVFEEFTEEEEEEIVLDEEEPEEEAPVEDEEPEDEQPEAETPAEDEQPEEEIPDQDEQPEGEIPEEGEQPEEGELPEVEEIEQTDGLEEGLEEIGDEVELKLVDEDYMNPSLPKVLSITAYADGDDKVNVSWVIKSSGLVNDLEFEWSTSSIFPGHRVDGEPTSLETHRLILSPTTDKQTITGLDCGQTIYMRVRTRDNSTPVPKHSEWSQVVDATPNPDAPSTLSVTPLTYRNVILKWPTVAGVDGYALYRDGTLLVRQEENLFVKDGSLLTLENNGLVRGVQYTYEVASYMRVNNKLVESENRTVAVFKAAPLAPTNIKAVPVGVRSVTVSWEASDGATGYRVYMKPSSAPDTAYECKAVTVENECTISELNWSAEYSVYVTATYSNIDSEGVYTNEVESERSKPILYTQTAPAPSNITHSHTASYVHLEWDPVSDASGYIVMRTDEAHKDTPWAADPMSDPNWTHIATVWSNAGKDRYEVDDNKSMTLGTEYFYQIRTFVNSIDLYGDPSTVFAEGLSPQAPTNLTLTNAEGTTEQIVVSWHDPNPSGSIDGFEIERTTDGKKANLKTFLIPTHTTNYTDTDVKTGTKYYYRVRSYHDMGSYKFFSEYSDYAIVESKPGNIKNFTAVRKPEHQFDNKITLSWDSLSDVGSYKLYMYQDGSDKGKLLATIGGTKTEYLVTGLKMGSSYVFGISASRKGTSVFSDITLANYGQLEIPQVQNLKSAPASKTSVKLTWDALPGVTGYDITVKSTQDTEYKTFTTSTTAKTVTIKELRTGYEYVATVNAYSTVDGSKVQGGMPATMKIIIRPDAPKSIKVTADAEDKALMVTWAEVQDAMGYQIWRSTTETGTFTKIGDISDGTEYYKDVDSTLDFGKTYYYKVLSYIKTENSSLPVESDFSPVGYARVLAPAPKDFEVNANGNLDEVILSWTKVDNTDGYKVYRATSKTGKYTMIKQIPGNTNVSYKDSGLTFGKAYYYKVVAYNTISGADFEGAFSEIVSGKATLGAPMAPNVVLLTDATFKSVYVQWDCIPDATSYNLYMVDDFGSNPKKVKSVSVKATAATASATVTTGFMTDESYKFCVTAVRKGVEGVMSAESAPIQIIVPKVVWPTNYLTLNSLTSIKLTWDKVKNVSYYQTRGKKHSDSTWIMMSEKVTSNTFTIKDMEFAREYDFQVRAVYKEKSVDEPFYGDWSDVKTAYTTPLPATPKTASVTKDSVKVSWKSMPSAEGYRVYIVEKDGVACSELKYSIISSDTAFEVLLTGLTANTKYKLAVVSLCSNGSSGFLESPRTKTVSFTTKKP